MKRHLFLGLFAMFAASSGHAAAVTGTDCYDTVVSARAAHQVSSPIPACDDCIVMRWPWFLDLDVKRITYGKIDKPLRNVLSLQHAPYKAKYWTWWLRHNSAGGFNVVGMVSVGDLRVCSPNAPLAPPYLKPAQGKSLEDLRREADRLHSE